MIYGSCHRCWLESPLSLSFTHTHTRTHTHSESDDAFEDASGRSSPSDDELGEHWNPDCKEGRREGGREEREVKGVSPYIKGKFRKVTKKRNLSRLHDVGM